MYAIRSYYEGEFRRVLSVIATMKHGSRNRAAVMLSFYAGLRVGEIAALTIGDVVDAQGQVKERILLRAATTKSGEARAVFVGSKLRLELESYLAGLGRPQRDGDRRITSYNVCYTKLLRMSRDVTASKKRRSRASYRTRTPSLWQCSRLISPHSIHPTCRDCTENRLLPFGASPATTFSASSSVTLPVDNFV